MLLTIFFTSLLASLVAAQNTTNFDPNSVDLTTKSMLPSQCDEPVEPGRSSAGPEADLWYNQINGVQPR